MGTGAVGRSPSPRGDFFAVYCERTALGTEPDSDSKFGEPHSIYPPLKRAGSSFREVKIARDTRIHPRRHVSGSGPDTGWCPLRMGLSAEVFFALGEGMSALYLPAFRLNHVQEHHTSSAIRKHQEDAGTPLLESSE